MSSILILGASYGSLLATRFALAGHQACLVCTPGTAEFINAEGTRVPFPVRGREEPVEVDSRKLSGPIRAAAPADVQPGNSTSPSSPMQESQYAEPVVRQLVQRVARAGIPCLAVMNMPPLPYLRRIPGLDVAPLTACYTDASVWDQFEPGLVSLASPTRRRSGRRRSEERAAVRPADQLQVRAVRARARHRLLRRLEADIEDARYEVEGGSVELPVKLKVHDSLFVPLAKWPMLMTGNYRCIGEDDMVPIANAVHDDLDRSRAIYQWTADLCVALGAQPEDLVPFEKYAQAAASLKKPSSAARASSAAPATSNAWTCSYGPSHCRRACQHPEIDTIVRRVDERLRYNAAARERLAA